MKLNLLVGRQEVFESGDNNYNFAVQRRSKAWWSPDNSSTDGRLLL